MQLNSFLTTCIYAEKSALNLHIQRFIVMSNPKLLPLLRIVQSFALDYKIFNFAFLMRLY